MVKFMVADLCHVVLSSFRGEKAKRRHATTRQMVTFSCFRVTTFSRKNDTFHASPFRLLFVVSLPGGAKGRHAQTRQNHHLECFRVTTFRPARRRYDTFIRGEFSPSICGGAKGRHAKTRHVLSVKCT